MKGCQQRVLASVKKFFRAPGKGGLAKNHYTKLERQTQLLVDLGLVWKV
jgi:hypothetical protein